MNKFLFFILCAFVFTSCDEKELEFSCNPEINNIVKSSEFEFSKIGLAELLEYDIELQKAIFRSFELQKKKSIWVEKFDSLLVNTQFKYKEILHISILSKYVFDSYFNIEKADSIIILNQKLFENEWIAFAKDSLFWSSEKIHFITSSLCYTYEQYEQHILDMEEFSINSLSSSCNCSTESDDCGDIGAVYCEEGGCTEKSGCGFLYLYNCNGGCEF
jgi:hypothetical protein